MPHFQSKLTDKHLSVVNYFIKNPFGSNPSVLTYLSTLAPIDRCVILEKLFELTKPDINLYDKLVLAYVKVGKPDFAKKLIDDAVKLGKPEVQQLAVKLSLPVPEPRSSSQQLAMFKDYLSKTRDRDEIEFLNLLIKFIS